MSKLVSLEELIKNKVKIQKSDDKEINATLHVPSLGGNIKVSYTKNDIIDFRESVQALDKNLSEKERSELYARNGYDLVYTVISEPNLKDKELQKAYECDEPSDIVTKIFTDGEIGDIMDFIADKAGYKTNVVVEVDDLKN